MAVGGVVRGDKPLSGEFDLGRISRQAGSAVNDFALVKSKTCFKRAIRGYTQAKQQRGAPTPRPPRTPLPTQKHRNKEAVF